RTQKMSECFFFSSRRRHTRSKRDWSSDVCSSDLGHDRAAAGGRTGCTTGRVAVGVTSTLAPSIAAAGPGSTAGSRQQSAHGTARSEERRVGKESRDRGGGARSTTQSGGAAPRDTE